MTNGSRMSPLTAMFLGVFFVGAVAIAAAGSVVLYGMRIVDSKSSALIHFAGNTVEGLPELVRSLPPAIGDLLHDRRAPEYAGKIAVETKFVVDKSAEALRPVLTIRNTGEEVVSLLAIRVAALDRNGVPQRDWTEVVATPLAIDDDWRGPLMPGSTRYVVLSGSRSLAGKVETLTPAFEISDIRVWERTAE